jgi:hypothetical protein
MNVGTVRRGGHPVVGFGDAPKLDTVSAYGPATAAIIALRADPNRCQSVEHSESVTGQAVLNFKRAWNRVPGAKPIPEDASFDSATADAVHQVVGGDTLLPACTPVPHAAAGHRAVWWALGGLGAGGFLTFLFMRGVR